jgi:hypothetical protein
MIVSVRSFHQRKERTRAPSPAKLVPAPCRCLCQPQAGARLLTVVAHDKLTRTVVPCPTTIALPVAVTFPLPHHHRPTHDPIPSTFKGNHAEQPAGGL